MPFRRLPPTFPSKPSVRSHPPFPYYFSPPPPPLFLECCQAVIQQNIVRVCVHCDRRMRVTSYINDHEDLGSIHLWALVDLHRRVRNGLYLRALRVFANRELLAVRGCLDFKLLSVKFGNLDFLVTDKCEDFSLLAWNVDAASFENFRDLIESDCLTFLNSRE